ncbi:hypothetical protein [Microcystis aeruginosa]|uniref:hypothetical protein n=1 Tax=Microcystis TaxID=1125 RepID=UPI002246CF53|nr:hypothetical protein [Microcystis aeruginosa]UZO76476.1 hypothetical protein M8120_28125 [Microcystis aeruginosa str. Chao 1910]
MRNVNLNILKFLESVNNFCLSLANIGLGDSILRVRSPEIGDRSQEIGDFFYLFSPLPHTLHPTPHTPHPTSHTPLSKKIIF